MPGDRRQILSLLRLPIPPLQPIPDNQFSTRGGIAQLCFRCGRILVWSVVVAVFRRRLMIP